MECVRFIFVGNIETCQETYSILRLKEPPVNIFLRLIGSNYGRTKVTLLSGVDCILILKHVRRIPHIKTKLLVTHVRPILYQLYSEGPPKIENTYVN